MAAGWSFSAARYDTMVTIFEDWSALTVATRHRGGVVDNEICMDAVGEQVTLSPLDPFVIGEIVVMADRKKGVDRGRFHGQSRVGQMRACSRAESRLRVCRLARCARQKVVGSICAYCAVSRSSRAFDGVGLN